MNSGILSPQICYAAAIAGAFITALSQILLKTQANTTGKKGFLQKFLNIRVIVSYGLLFLTLAISLILAVAKRWNEAASRAEHDETETLLGR